MKLIIYSVGHRKENLQQSREQLLEKHNLTIGLLAKYYGDNLRLSIYKSLLRNCLNHESVNFNPVPYS